MPKTIHLRVKKELDSTEQQKVLKFKGVLIKNCYTEIIHLADEDEKFHLNFFTVSEEDKKHVEDFIQRYITENELGHLMCLVKGNERSAFYQH